MRQLDIDFFWPLTHQIPLDLDYYEGEKPKQYYTHPLSGTFLISNGGTTSSYLSANNLTVDVDSTVFKMTEKPNIVRRILLNTLGIKWEKK
jgi:hypothetical protein